MKKDRLVKMVLLIAGVLLLFPLPVYAYMDPGTTGSIFSMLAPLLAVIVGVIGFLLLPFRRFFKAILTRIFGESEDEPAADNGQPAPDDAPDEHENE